MADTPVYLDSYTLQSDLRIRLPKSIVGNLNVVPGKTCFSFFYNSKDHTIIMKLNPSEGGNHD